MHSADICKVNGYCHRGAPVFIHSADMCGSLTLFLASCGTLETELTAKYIYRHEAGPVQYNQPSEVQE